MSDIRFNRWLHQSGTGGVFQDSSGNVGIGSSVPRSALDIVGVINVTGNINSTGVSTFATANITQSNPTNLSVTGVSTFSSGPVIIGTGTSTGTASQRLQVSGGAYVSGNLGLGNSNPLSPLDISGGQFRIRASGTYSDPTDNAGIIAYDSISGDLNISARSNGGSTALAFRTSNGGIGAERVRITSSGGIGIGTNNPNNRQLSVYGSGFNGTQIECRSTAGGSSGLSMYAGRNFEIQSTASNEANYPSSFLVYDRDANGYRMAIDGSGRLQIPAQPGFCASGTAGAANQPSTGDSAMLGTLFNTTSHTGGFNTGSHYSTGTGIFTAPVAGKYYTFFNMRWETGNFVQNSYIRIYISKNNIDTLLIHQINGQNEAWANYMAMSCSGIIDLAAGDTLRPKGGLNGGTAVGWWNESSWGAWLLG